MTTITMEASNKAINTKIAAIKRTGAKLNVDIQDTIVMIMRHCNGVGNGDISGATRLVRALPKTHRRNLVMLHFTTYGPVKFTGGADNVKASLDKGDKAKAWDIEAAELNKWWDSKAAQREPEMFTFFDTEKQVISLADRLEKRLDQTDDEGKPLVSDSDRPKIMAQVQYLRAIKDFDMKLETPKTGDNREPLGRTGTEG